MLTIPANMQTALKKNPNQEFRYIIKMGRSLIADPYTASNFYFSSNAAFGANNVGITDTNVYPIVPILIKEPAITENLIIREHKSTVGGFSIDLDDNFLFQNPANSDVLEKFSDQLNKYNISNRDLYVYLWLGGLTNLQTECLAIYQGVVGDFKVKNGIMNIQISNSAFKVQKELPQEVITPSEYRNTPPETIGKSENMVYGDHSKFYYDNTDPSLYSNEQKNDLVPMTLIQNDESENDSLERLWHLAGHKMDAVTAIWGYDSNLKSYVLLQSADWNTHQNTIAGCIIMQEGTDFYHYVHPKGATRAGVGDPHWGDKNDCSRWEYPLLSLAECDCHGMTIGQNAGLLPQFPEMPINVDDITGDTAVFILVDNNDDGGTFTFLLEGNDILGSGTGAFTNSGTYGVGDDYYVGGNANRVNINVIASVNIDGNWWARVYYLYLRLQYSPANHAVLPLFASCKGREASATVAGHFSELAENDLLEIPAHIVDSIIYDELGETIDTASMQAVATEQASWKIAPLINKKQNSKDIIDKIAKQSMSFIHWNATNKAAMDTFFAANDTDYIFKLNDIKNRPLLYESSLKDIVNDFVLKYKKDGNSGNLQSTVEREDDRANVGSQAIYNAVMDKVMDADFISDPTTAGLLADHWAKTDDDSFWSILHNIIEFETVDLRGVNFWNAGTFDPIVKLELTDIIKLHEEWDAKMECFGETWIKRQFKIFSMTRLPDTLKIKAIQISGESIKSISFGDEYVFEATNGTPFGCFKIDSTHFVVCYYDDGNNRIEACVATVDGTTITYGARATFNDANFNNGKITKLDSTHFVICYWGTASRAIIGTIDGDTIAFGDASVFNAGWSYSISCGRLDNTHFVICYKDGAGATPGESIIGTVSEGDVIGFNGAELQFSVNNLSDSAYIISCSILDSTHFAVCYRERTTEIGIARIGVVTGDAIAYGDEVTFNNAAISHINSAKIDSAHFVIGYRDEGNANFGTAIIGVVTGNAIAFGSEYVFKEAATTQIFCKMIDNRNILVAFADNATDGRLVEGVITGNVIAFGNTYRFDTTNIAGTGIAILNEIKIAICYGDQDSAWNGTAIIGELVY